MIKRIILFILMLGVACAASARAQIYTPIAPLNSSSAYSAITVGTTDQSLSVTGKAFLEIINLSSSATICVNLGAAATIAGAQCAAGEIPISPLSRQYWAGTFVPSDIVHVIASAAATPATVGAK